MNNKERFLKRIEELQSELRRSSSDESLTKDEKSLREGLIRMLSEAAGAYEREYNSLSFVGFCSIIEACAAEHRGTTEHLDFPKWVKGREEQDLHTPTELDIAKYRKTVCQNWNDYNLEFGKTSAFVEVVVFTYQKRKEIPDFIASEKTTRENGFSKTEGQNPDELTYEELWKQFRCYLREVYAQYRSPIVHSATPLPFSSRIIDMLGISTSHTPSAFTLGTIACAVIEEQIPHKH